MSLFSQNIQRKFWKIQRKFFETGYFCCWPYNLFCRIYKMVGCITEFLMILLTPIFKYIYVKCQMSYKSYMTFMSYMTCMVLWHTPCSKVNIYIHPYLKAYFIFSTFQVVILKTRLEKNKIGLYKGVYSWYTFGSRLYGLFRIGL